jgi:hypothetical protein
MVAYPANYLSTLSTEAKANKQLYEDAFSKFTKQVMEVK